MKDQLLQSAWRAYQAGNHAETARIGRAHQKRTMPV